ncbi:DUF87 domain-containing protein [Thermoanaerobacter thermohydrosulfuricus]
MSILKKKVQKSKIPQLPDSINIIDFEEKDSEPILSKLTLSQKDIIAPNGFKISESYVKIGDKYAVNLIITGFPERGFIGWLQDLYSIGDSDVTISITPFNAKDAQNELNKIRLALRTKVKMDMEVGDDRSREIYERALNDIDALKQRIADDVDALFTITVTTTIYDDDLNNLKKTVSHLKDLLGGKNIDIRNLLKRQDDIYLTTLPLSINKVRDLKRPADLGGLVSLFPFYQGELVHPKGFPIGINMGTGTIAMLDTFHPSFNNYNMFICGEAGGGKSFTLKTITKRSSIFEDVVTVNIDFKGESVDLAERTNSLNITFSPSNDIIINPLELEFDEIDNQLDVLTKISEVVSLISYMIANASSEDSPKALSSIEIALLNDVITDIYINDFGFRDNDINSLYTDKQENDNPNIIYIGLARKKMPTITDVYNKLYDLGQKGNEKAKELAYILKLYTRGNTFGMFDGQTNIDIKNYKYINFDISKLEEKRVRPLAQYVVFTFIWEKFIKKNKKQKKRVNIDEAHLMLYNEESARFVDKMVRLARAYNTSIVNVSQDFEIFEEKMHSILDNSSIKIFLRHSGNRIQSLKKTFMLSDGVGNFLVTNKKGEAIFMLNNTEIYPIYIDATPEELKLFNTDPNKTF